MNEWKIEKDEAAEEEHIENIKHANVFQSKEKVFKGIAFSVLRVHAGLSGCV